MARTVTSEPGEVQRSSQINASRDKGTFTVHGYFTIFNGFAIPKLRFNDSKVSCTLCCPHLVSIVEESVVEEAVGEEEVAAHDGKVEELAEDEPAKVDIVPEVRLC